MRGPKTIVPSTATLRPVPAWGRVKKALTSDTDAAFAAGTGLAVLDAVVRTEPVFAGVWRQRLALSAAAATARLTGRREDEAALRDAWCFCTSGADPGPAGAILRIWRQLATRSSGWSDTAIEEAARTMGIDLEGRAGELVKLLDARAPASPPAVAAAMSTAVVRILPEAELLALMLADLVLAITMRWRMPVPLLRPITLATAYALAATAAVDLAIDLDRRAGLCKGRCPSSAPRARRKSSRRCSTMTRSRRPRPPGR